MKWKLEKLVDVCDFQGGTQPPKSEWLNEKRDGYIRMVQIRDFTQGKESFVEYVKDSKKLKKCSASDIMIGRYGASIGKILTGLDGAYNVALVKTIPSNKLDRNYFYHYLNASYFQNFIQNAGSRAAQAGFNKEELKELQIGLPPIPTQQKIAAILDEADALRRKDKALLAKYDELLEAVFYDMFGDPVKNEKGWGIEKIEHLIKDGPQNGLYKHSNDYGNGVPILRIDSFYDGVVNDIDKLKRVRASEDEINLFQIYENNIVINRVNSRSHLGKCAIIPKLLEPTVFESNMMRIEVDVEKVIPRYFSQIFSHSSTKKQILGRAKDAVNQASINQQDVKSFIIPLPPIKLQNDFAKIASQIESLKSQIIQQQTHSEDLFQSLMQQAFKGELEG